MRKIIYSIGILFLLASCNTHEDNKTQTQEEGRAEHLQYARGFTITDYDGYKKVSVRDPIDTSKIIIDYYLIEKGAQPDELKGKSNVIQVPLNSIACLSTTHVGFLSALGLTDKLIAFSGTKYIFSEQVRALIAAGKIKEAGDEGDLNYELLIQLHPDIIMTYQMGDPAYDHFDKLQSLNLHPVINQEYRELTPLGQAEWIKFIAAFFDKEDTAQKIFDVIAAQYNAIKKTASSAEMKPSVFTGMSFHGQWTIPGGKSFVANYLADAGANYLWSDDNRTGNFPASFEDIVLRAATADFWLNPGAADNLDEIRKADKKNSLFDAYKNENVYNNNLRVNNDGGNDYWESGIVHPEWVLGDLVKIFHPELLPGHTFIYYKKLGH